MSKTNMTDDTATSSVELPYGGFGDNVVYGTTTFAQLLEPEHDDIQAAYTRMHSIVAAHAADAAEEAFRGPGPVHRYAMVLITVAVYLLLSSIGGVSAVLIIPQHPAVSGGASIAALIAHAIVASAATIIMTGAPGAASAAACSALAKSVGNDLLTFGALYAATRDTYALIEKMARRGVRTMQKCLIANVVIMTVQAVVIVYYATVKSKV